MWKHVDKQKPEPYVTVLVICNEWLYPATAFRFPDDQYMIVGPMEEDYESMKFIDDEVVLWMEIPD